MANTFVFTRFAEKKFLKLERDLQGRVRDKLRELKAHDRIVTVLKPLKNFYPATHRLRIGDYWLILQQLPDDEFLVLDIGHRSDIYS